MFKILDETVKFLLNYNHLFWGLLFTGTQWSCCSSCSCGYVLGKRPFGVSILYIGWDKHHGFQLYQSDPSGNYGGWKATCIGNNSAVSTRSSSCSSNHGISSCSILFLTLCH